MLIVVSGANGAGKTFLATWLYSRYGFCPLSFASPLRDIVSVITGFSTTELQKDEVKKGQWGSGTIRDLMINVADGIKKTNPSYFIDTIVRALRNDHIDIVIDDIRFSPELLAILPFNPLRLHLVQPGKVEYDATIPHGAYPLSRQESKIFLENYLADKGRK